jgi:hypothetical protein
MEFTTHITLKLPEKATKLSGGIIKVVKGCLSVHSKLPECIPSGKLKQQIQNYCVEWLW